MSDLIAYYMATPPIARFVSLTFTPWFAPNSQANVIATSRTLATAVFVSSVGIYTGILPSYHFFFHKSLVFKLIPEIHRFVTSFLLTGPQMAVLFDTYFVFHYLSQLERGSKFAKKEDLLWYLMFVGSVIIVGQASSVTASHAVISPLPFPFRTIFTTHFTPRIICPHGQDAPRLCGS